MKKYLLVSIVFVIFISIFSIEGIAQDTTDTQVTLKLKNLGTDMSKGGTKIAVAVTMNRTGNFVYAEEYYSPSASTQPNFCCGSRYEGLMNDYTISFELNRPDHDHYRRWSLVKSKILLDGAIVYEAWTGISGTYKSSLPEVSTNSNSSVAPAERIKPDKPKTTEQFVDIVREDNSTDGVNDIGNMKPMYNITSMEGTKQQVPIVGAPTFIIVMISVYIFRRMNR